MQAGRRTAALLITFLLCGAVKLRDRFVPALALVLSVSEVAEHRRQNSQDQYHSASDNVHVPFFLCELLRPFDFAQGMLCARHSERSCLGVVRMALQKLLQRNQGAVAIPKRHVSHTGNERPLATRNQFS